MSTNLIIQYTIVLLIVLAAIWRLAYKAVKKSRKEKGGNVCCGCSLSDCCSRSEHPHLHVTHEGTKEKAAEIEEHRCVKKKDCCR